MNAPPTAALPIADCPFCGSAPEIQYPGKHDEMYECVPCGYSLWPATWNRRAPAVQATADADELAREIVSGWITPPEHHMYKKRVEAVAAVIRKAVSPKAAQEDWKAKYDALYAIINTPHTDEWFEAVRLEAGFQIERWGTEHDAGKAPMDWFWLIGYLAGKALASQLKGDMTKAKHHTISSGAALLNWFRAMTGDTNSMRPGHAPSAEAAGDTAAVSGDKQEKERG